MSPGSGHYIILAFLLTLQPWQWFLPLLASPQAELYMSLSSVFHSLLQKSSSQTVTITAKQMTCKCIIPILTSHSDPMLMLLGLSPSTFQNLRVKISKMDILSLSFYGTTFISPGPKSWRHLLFFKVLGRVQIHSFTSCPKNWSLPSHFHCFLSTTTCMDVCNSLLIVLSYERPRSILIKLFLGQHIRD